MSQVTVVKVVVEELSKYGYKANGQYVGLSARLSDADKARLVPGASFEAEYFVADSGKQYLNKILSSVPSVQSAKAVEQPKAATTPAVDTVRAKKFTPKYKKKDSAISAGLSKDEWAAKDRRISRQGCIQAAVQALAPVMSEEGLFEKAAELANKMLEFVNQ